MIQLCQQEQCTGCWGCANACPHDAITMKPVGALGHLHPVVDEKRCVKCHLCERVCPQLSQPSMQSPKEAYAVWAKDAATHATSASGGVATVLARHCVECGGVVYGCAAVGSEVKHVKVDALDGLGKLQGSKYVQSSIGTILRDVRDDLHRGVSRVLFFGTPCQCAALRKFLGRDHGNLLMVDLICHGCPPLSLYSRHVETIATGRPIDNVTFRGENGFCLTITSDGRSIYKNYVWTDRYTDAYFTAFMHCYTFRDSCYQCPYAKSERVADITIGDFWGLDPAVAKEYDLSNGVSVVLPITPKGRNALQAISDRLNIVARPVKEAIKGNAQLNYPSKKPLRAKLLRALMQRGMSLKEAIRISDWYLIPLYKLRDHLK